MLFLQITFTVKHPYLFTKIPKMFQGGPASLRKCNCSSKSCRLCGWSESLFSDKTLVPSVGKFVRAWYRPPFFLNVHIPWVCTCDFSSCKITNKLEETCTIWDNFHHLNFKLPTFINTFDLKSKVNSDFPLGSLFRSAVLGPVLTCRLSGKHC